MPAWIWWSLCGHHRTPGRRSASRTSGFRSCSSGRGLNRNSEMKQSWSRSTRVSRERCCPSTGCLGGGWSQRPPKLGNLIGNHAVSRSVKVIAEQLHSGVRRAIFVELRK